MKLLKHILIILLLNAGSVFASEKLFSEANMAYEGGNYKEAISKYAAILETSSNVVEVYFNMANAYYRMDELGLSILYFEKVLKLDPANPKAKHNLQLAYLKSNNQIEPLPKLIFVEWWQQLLTYRSANSWATWAVCLAWVGVGVFALNGLIKKTFFKAFAWVIVLLCLMHVFLAIQNNKLQIAYHYAIIMSEEVQLRAGPNASDQEVRIAYEGLKVELLDRVDDWTKIRLEDNNEAWIESSKLLKI
ncbi:MAG: tetratricopeptide repeat protein [Chitinophagales bacterium]|tara:strand:+ start:50060 stop:50800 length:741 start_codon:yes stop_codon:yes gene_type:complete